MENMGNFMKQAKEMQKKMHELQSKLDSYECEGHAGGGIITIAMNGKLDVLRTVINKDYFKGKIPDEYLDKLDLSELEDLICAAIDNVKSKVENYVQDQMHSVTGNMNLPGF